MEQRSRTQIPAELKPAVAFEDSFDALYGLEIVDDAGEDGTVRGRARITDDLPQQFGLLHGGVIAAMAESLASRGTWFGGSWPGQDRDGALNETNFVRPITSGHLNQTAQPRRRGRTRWLWEVQLRDDARRLCAISMVNIAVASLVGGSRSRPRGGGAETGRRSRARGGGFDARRRRYDPPRPPPRDRYSGQAQDPTR